MEIQEPDRYVKICGEKKSADSEVVASFCDDFAELIEKEKYELRDVYNSNETGLFYFQVKRSTFFFLTKKDFQICQPIVIPIVMPINNIIVYYCMFISKSTHILITITSLRIIIFKTYL